MFAIPPLRIMTSYQKLKKKIADLEADRLRLLDDASYYVDKVLRRKMYLDWQKRFWLGDNEPTGGIKGLLESLLKNQDNNANNQEGQSEAPPEW